MTAGVVEVLAEALAQHQLASLLYDEGRCACGYWFDVADDPHSDRIRRMHREHVASVVAALPNIAIVPNEGTTRRYSAAYRNFDGDIVPVGVAYSKRAWAEEVRIEWQRDEPNSKYFIVYRDVPEWQEADQ